MKKIIVMLIFSMFCGGMMHTSVMAQAPAPQNSPVYDGIDVLLIIDQSGSMGGARFGLDPRFASTPTDPQGLRFLTPQFILQELSQVRLYQVGFPKPDIHMAVLAFGDDTEQLMAWTPLVPEIAPNQLVSTDQWNAELASLNDILSEQRFGFRNLGFTNFNRAFERGRDFFQAMPPQLAPAPGENRLRVVVVVTDGAPCKRSDIFDFIAANPDRPDYNCNDVLYDGTARRHMNELVRQARTYFPAPGYELFVVMFDPTRLYADVVKPWWNEVVCPGGVSNCDVSLRNASVYDEIELSAQLKRIINAITGYVTDPGILNKVDISCCPPSDFTILPYQQVLRLNIFKNQPQPLPNLQFVHQQTGSVVPSDAIGLNTLIETHEIRDPRPGRYVLSASDYNLIRDISLDSLSIAAGARLSALTPDPLTALGKFTAQLDVINSVGNVIERYFDAAGNESYPLSVELRLYDATSPDARTRPLVASFPMAISSPDTHRYSAEYTLDETFEGLYELRVHATFVADDGKTYTLLNDKPLRDNITVQGAAVVWEGLMPGSQRVGRPISLQSKIVNKQTGQSIIDTSAIQTRLEVLALDGTVVVPAMILPNVSPNTSAGEIESIFTIDNAGGYNIRADLGTVDAFGNFDPLGPIFTAPIEIRPLQLVNLNLTQPNIPQMEIWEFTLVPFKLPTTSDPTTIQVEVRDQNGYGVDLSTLTGGREDVPTVFIRQGTQTANISSQLSRISTGVYALNTTELGLGEYQIEAVAMTPNDQLAGDYAWASTPTDSLTLNRVISPTLFTTGIGIAIGVLIALMVAFWSARQIVSLSQNPLSGTMGVRTEIITADGQQFFDPVKTFSLDTPRRHTRTFKNIGDIRSITVSTDRSEQLSKAGSMKIVHCVIDGLEPNQMMTGQFVDKGSSVLIASIPSPDGTIKQIYIEKDVRSLGLDDWNRGFDSSNWIGGTTVIDNLTKIGKDTQWG